MTELRNNAIVELTEAQLSDVQGGLIGLLVPAVQRVREAAQRVRTTAEGGAISDLDS